MKILLAVIIVVVVFEIIEHVIAPLVWTFVTRKKRSKTGAAGLLGKAAKVKRWRQNEGYVLVKGELWIAVSNDPLSVGDEVVVERVDGLTLTVTAERKS